MNILSFLTPKDDTAFLESDSTIRQALEKYDYHKYSVIPIIDGEGHYITSISEGDILRFIKNNCNFDIEIAENTCVCDLDIHRPYKALDINCSTLDVVKLSQDQNFIPMIDDRGMFIGIVKRRNVINYLSDKFLKDIK